MRKYTKTITILLTATSPILADAQDMHAPPINHERGLFDGRWAGNSYFDQRSNRVEAKTRERLIELTAKSNQLPTYKQAWCPYTFWVMVGHADPSEGTRSAQERISIERAQYIASLVATYGIPREHICTEHKGSTQSISALPINNRRVEIEVVCQVAPR